MSQAVGDMRAGAVTSAAPMQPPRARLAGDPGVWLFITADVFAFALFFVLFAWGRVHNAALYERSRQALDAGIGLANTLILVSSSGFMVLAVEAARDGSKPRTMRNLSLAMLVGSALSVTKVVEYTGKIQPGITMLSNELFMYYFAL